MRSTRTSMRLSGMILFVIICAGADSARAQTPSASPAPAPKASATPTLEREFFKNILQDQKAIWTSPFHLRGKDARWLAPLGLGTAILIATDRRTGDEIGEFHDQLDVSRYISYAGSDYGVASVALTFYAFGRAKHNDRARETGLFGGEALIDGAIVVAVLKEISQRRRPLATKGRGDFFKGGTSFPSGHAIESWALATVIANEYHDHRLVQISAYGIATAVSLSRFTGRKHYLSDLLVGSAMGYGIGRYVYRAHHRQTADSGNEDKSSGRSRLMPLMAPEYNRRAHEYGAALVWSF
jgi:membrane-associated phospholipid phosphatase